MLKSTFLQRRKNIRASRGGDRDGHDANAARVRRECRWNEGQCAEMMIPNENTNIAGAMFSTVDLFSRPNSCVGVPTDDRRDRNRRQSEVPTCGKVSPIKNFTSSIRRLMAISAKQLKALQIKKKKRTVSHNLLLAVSKKRRRKKGRATFWQSALVPSFPPTPPPSGAWGILIGPLPNCNFF